LFENPDFEVDKNAEEFRLLNPVLARLGKDKTNKSEAQPMEVVSKVLFIVTLCDFILLKTLNMVLFIAG
jgi:hypothetical protein